ncbi:5-methyltetrahydropteroyltriglutamate--homocysteine S-methyltransferase [Tamlana sp. 2_MG-2023]|uniref:5-methyltetrahydropteroyltriglutamate-- homocysteine S-methyltransferase n=1 Tax=unclassified Tamlana TaxID=2614803 RepID=UPI0026E3F525|nr:MULTISPECIES: 5-methyltetrahydropteroyltriglutamate--homocysteine S-methyltransferase [unclassified Tamlana]MDO6761569.1 5-methyltetrahydropteroyltriglutamate--homocysteine S-methyltransferase [Tamlana sp. 2_MG-2023]MDO6792301.1 5-methyltetrahydropteroyltriglutamate--homocysteine S-methyltransferase [Tamlana sp. 1_MG-2023]
MKTTILGHPRIGSKRELKKACEAFWANNIDEASLVNTASEIKKQNWLQQQTLGIDAIPSNDFSFYDQVLDTCLTLGCIPKRYNAIDKDNYLELYFAMARGLQKDHIDVTAMEMTKWFDTNYHYIVPEFEKDQNFEFFSKKIIEEYKEALNLGIKTKPVLIGPITFLLLGKKKEPGFHRLELLPRLLPVYFEILTELDALNIEYIQFDEPCLALNLSTQERDAIASTYEQIATQFPNIKIYLANYFDCYGDNLDMVLQLPVDTLHLDLVRCPSQLDDILESKHFNPKAKLALGLIDGRNIWKNDFENSLKFIEKASKKIPLENLWITASCSLLHTPYDLDLETQLSSEIKQWLAFSKQKIEEIVTLKNLSSEENSAYLYLFEENKLANLNRKRSKLIHNNAVKARISNLKPEDSQRKNEFSQRQAKQKQSLNLPLFPTTTIGSFPQTKIVRNQRLQHKKGVLSQEAYNQFIAKEIEDSIRFQERIGLDVLVHGEFERNDMVEYFGEKLNGFAFSNYGWVQSYGSRCVKPPILFGDVSREKSMTVDWSKYAQSLTDIPVKGMLTGPVTILQWSFVRNDQPRATTCNQIALAIRDEVIDLENNGLKIIQIDEPAIREGLPLRKEEWQNYLDWAVKAFRISASGVKDETQIHTHMCYSEFNDIISNIADMDADVITIETSRSKMELLDAFVNFKYPNEIGPGVYDIHSPRVPSLNEIEDLLTKAKNVLPHGHIWVNPDCGLKTRDWPETKKALEVLVKAAKKLRKSELEYV